MIYNFIAKVPGLCSGDPTISRRRITVENVVTGIYYSEDMDDYLDDLSISREEASQAVAYCRSLECQKEAPFNYCCNCVLRTIKDGYEFDPSGMQEITNEDGSKFVVDGNNIFLGGIEEYEQSQKGVEGWKLAELVFEKYGERLGLP